MSLSDEHRAYITYIAERTGKSRTEIAMAAGVHPSTLSHLFRPENRERILQRAVLRRIEASSGYAFRGALPPQPAPPAAARNIGFAEIDATPLIFENATETPLQAAVMAIMAGRDTIDAWTLKSRALELAGYLPGDILLVDLGARPKPGDVVCARKHHAVAPTAATLFRIYEPPCLVAATVDRELLRPYIVDDSTITVRGVVRAMLRQPAAPPH